MNQGRIWCVVNPTVGLPLFIGSVALTSLAVHYSILTHTNWMSSYWQGAAKGKAALDDTIAPVAGTTKADPAFVITVAPATSAKQETSFVITVAPNRAAKVDTAAIDADSGPAETLAMTAVAPN